MSRSNVVVIGGGMIGAGVATALAKNNAIQVTLVDPKSYFENNLSSVRTQVIPEFFEKSSVQHSAWAKSIDFVQGSAVSVRDHSVVVRKPDGTDQELKFDYGVIAMGTSYGAFKADAPTIEGRRAALKARADLIKNARSILLVGGGSVGVEMLGEILAAYPDKKVTLVHAQSEVIQDAPGAHALFLQLTQKHPNAKFIGNDRVEVKVEAHDALQPSERLEMKTYYTQQGIKIDADFVISAVGITPNSAALQTHLEDALTAQRYVKTEPTLQVAGHPSLFVVGDLAEIGKMRAVVNYKDHVTVVSTNIGDLINHKPAKATYAPKALATWPMVNSFGPNASISVLAMCGVVKNTWKMFSNLKTGFMQKLPPNM